MLTLFFAPGASSMAPHIALHEIGAPFEGKPISFSKKVLRRPDYLALNPEGKVPLLLVDGRPMTEVAAILFYLARRFPEAHLLPDDIEAQAQAISWMSFIASTVHPARRQGLEHVMKVYALVEEKLGPRDWVLDSYSVADIHLFRLFWRMLSSLKPERSAFPNLVAHHDRMLARAAVKKSIEIESAIGTSCRLRAPPRAGSHRARRREIPSAENARRLRHAGCVRRAWHARSRRFRPCAPCRRRHEGQ